MFPLSNKLLQGVALGMGASVKHFHFLYRAKYILFKYKDMGVLMLFVVYDKCGELVDSSYDYSYAQQLAKEVGGYVCERIISPSLRYELLYGYGTIKEPRLFSLKEQKILGT